jgi:predicted nucleotidyltransferase
MATPSSTSISRRTISRMTATGALRGSRGRRRGLRPEEQEYLTSHGALLAALREVLRTERAVAAAVIFGSCARGQDGPASDVDIAVLARSPGGDLDRLRERLSGRVGRPVDLVPWDSLALSAEMAVAVARDGRPLVDRVGAFAALRADRDNASRRAARLRKRQWRGIQDLWRG